MPRQVHAACPHDCPDSCGVLITVDDIGRATRIQGDAKHPVTRGFLCAKVAKYLDRVYSPDRVLYPMRRIAPKGGGARGPADFVRIPWDEAYDEIAHRLKAVAAEFGPEAILPYSYAGNMAVLGNASMDRRFFHRMGASQLDRTICSSAGGDALITVLGRKLGTDPERFAQAKYIIAWGANVHATNVHLWPFIEEARRGGAKLVTIDPYKTRTAKCADWYLPINPGTDAALALAMMHVIIGEKLYDAEYVERATFGFDQLAEKARQFPPERVSKWTGIAAADIVALAREYATTQPAVIRVNYGVQRAENGGMAVRAITMLPCITGAWKHGGGVQLSTSGAFALNKKALEMPELMLKSPLGRPARVVNMSRLGHALTELSDPPVKAVFVYNSNPAAVAPNHNDVRRGLQRPDLFTAVHEQFFTDTTDYADILLPATTFFEHEDIQFAYGHYYLQHSAQAIEAPGECKPNVEVFSELGRRMGFADACFADSIPQMIDQALAAEDPFIDGITQAELKEHGHVRLKVGSKDDFLPFADGNFPTSNGKALLYNETLIAMGLDPVVEFTPPDESRHSPAAQKFPLEMLARKADNFLNSSFCNLPSHQPLEPKINFLEMTPADATPRGIAEGDEVRVFNNRGEVRLKAHVNGAVQPGVVATLLTWPKLTLDGQGINVLTSEKLTDIGGGATFYSCLVEVEKV